MIFYAKLRKNAVCFLICSALPCVWWPLFTNAQTSDGIRKNVYPSFAWANRPWIGNNRPYHEARVKIDRIADQGGLTLTLLNKYELACKQQPRNPLVLFQWAYADNLAKRRYPNLPLHSSPGDGAFDETEQVGLVDPRTYDYERVRFLLNWNANKQALLPLARRLSVYDPKDFAIQYQLAGLYSRSDTPKEKAASIARVKRLLAQYPNKPGLYSLLGGIYYEHWTEKKNLEDAKNAVVYYKKYLQLAPANDPWRKQAGILINDINHPVSY